MKKINLLPILMILVGCSGPVPSPTLTFAPSPQKTVTEEPEFKPYDHCVVTAFAVAYLDTNSNGIREDGEIPLSNILFHLTPSGSSNDHALTNQSGEAYLEGPYGPCDGIRIFAEPPPSLRLTTPATIDVSSSFGTRYLFGFEYEPSFATRTPAPASNMNCEIVRTDLGLVFDIRADPDGYVWISTDRVLIEFYPGLNAWKTHPIDGGLSVGMLSDNRVVAGFGEPSILNGSEWESLPWDDPGFLVGAVSDSAGDLWGLGTFGLYHFNNEYERIESIPIDGSNIGAIAITPDDRLWITGVSDLDLIAFQTSNRGDGESEFIEYDLNELGIQTDNRLLNVVVAPHGSLWFTTGDLFQPGGQALNFNPTTNSWTVFDSDTTNFSLGTHHIESVAVAEDGSVWLAAGFYGLAHLTPSNSGLPEDAQIEMHLPEELQGHFLTAVGIESPGVIWAGAESNIFRCESPD